MHFLCFIYYSKNILFSSFSIILNLRSFIYINVYISLLLQYPFVCTFPVIMNGRLVCVNDCKKIALTLSTVSLDVSRLVVS